LTEIAGEKAGILKAGVPCVVGRQEQEAFQVIERRAEELGSPLHVAGRDFDMYEQHGRLIFQTPTRLVDLPLPRLNGRHQIDNAGTAIAAASLLFGDGLTTRALEHGLTHAEWPARLECLATGGLHAYVADGTEIWLDGGHNAAGGQVTAHALAELDERVPRPVHLIFGMMDTKDAHAFIAPFKGLVERVVLTRHGLRNALIPVLTLFGLQVAWLMGGVVIVEQVFAWAGMGQLMIKAVFTRDMAIVQAGVFVFSLIVMGANLVVDLMYTVLDPRIRYR